MGTPEQWLQAGDSKKDAGYADGTVKKFIADIAQKVNPDWKSPMCAICCGPKEDPLNDPFVCIACLRTITENEVTNGLEVNIVQEPGFHDLNVMSDVIMTVSAARHPKVFNEHLQQVTNGAVSVTTEQCHVICKLLDNTHLNAPGQVDHSTQVTEWNPKSAAGNRSPVFQSFESLEHHTKCKAN
eukprot:COSAG02_NODE_1761_length_11029_cov_46.691034_3_plen_184_part_00